MAKRVDLVPNPFTYQNTLSNNNAGGKTNDDIIEVYIRCYILYALFVCTYN